MNSLKQQNMIKLSDHPGFGKPQVGEEGKSRLPGRERAEDFIETLFRFLGDRRRVVASYLRMKLDRKMRTVFHQDLEKCRDMREEGRCVKKYFKYLRLTDAGNLLAGLPDLIPGKIEALTYHGESAPARRLMKFAATFDISHEEATVLMLMMLMTRDRPGREKEYAIAKG